MIIEAIVHAIRKAYAKFLGLEECKQDMLSGEEVARALEHLALKRPVEKLDWQHSVVDLLKLLRLDSSIGARDALAVELELPSIDVGTAAGNTVLYDAVVEAVAEHRIELPCD